MLLLVIESGESNYFPFIIHCKMNAAQVAHYKGNLYLAILTPVSCMLM